MSTSGNGLVRFTNCLLPQEDGSLEPKDLWVDEDSGLILDAQKTFYQLKQRPTKTIDLDGNILSPGFIDIQINGGYGFDFSVYEGDEAYLLGMRMIAERIVETGVTSLLPTVITQEKSLYPKLLPLLKPTSTPQSATLLGWHAEGPFIEYAKRGAHSPPLLLSAPDGYQSFEETYGSDNLVDKKVWDTEKLTRVGVRLITTAPELPGVMHALPTLVSKGIIVSIGHSVATTNVATSAVKHGAKLITHLFNAMPQFNHRDPSIIGLLGASPHLNSPDPGSLVSPPCEVLSSLHPTPSGTLSDLAERLSVVDIASMPASRESLSRRPSLHLEKGQIAAMSFERPFYGIIVDGIHCHPNSVRLAYAAHPEGCILITDAMKLLDPNLKNGVHEWRDGQKIVKEGERLYLEGTETLAGSVVTLDKCVRNFSRFTGCSIGEAIKCATYNPARCLGIEHAKGTLRAGADADLVVLDRQGKVLRTWVRGKEIWSDQSL